MRLAVDQWVEWALWVFYGLLVVDALTLPLVVGYYGSWWLVPFIVAAEVFVVRRWLWFGDLPWK